tara:strand:+ start:1864 stop:2499 length:636 start_codon:yes stop_codon:yes gene_type:complete
VTTLGRIIRGPVDVREGANWLASHDPRLAWVLDRTGPLPLRLAPQGFKGLLDIIVSQQVSVASANAIRARMDAARLTSEAAVLAAGEEGMRAAGFSKPKARYAVALAQAKLDYMSLRQMPDAEVIAALTSVLGIGPWTAQIYVMFCMGRADMFPPGDLALQEAARVIYDLPARPTAQELEQLAETWSPWRSVAARALFAYYRDMKNREGLG